MRPVLRAAIRVYEAVAVVAAGILGVSTYFLLALRTEVTDLDKRHDG